MISRSVVTEDKKEISGAAQLRLVKKELAKIEKQLERVIVQEQELIKEQESASFDHERLLEVSAKLTDIGKVRSELEDKWLELSGQVKE
jgi:regulator of sigma D